MDYYHDAALALGALWALWELGAYILKRLEH
jgi:hypothetical protein